MGFIVGIYESKYLSIITHFAIITSMTVSRSPQRNTFQVDASNKRRAEQGLDPDEDFIALWEYWEVEDQKREQSAEWQEYNLEYDLRTTPWILDKVRASETYAQNLYAALCNMQFVKLEVIPLLTDRMWSCSWRHAGGIVADMREQGDYIDWYCSGISNEVTDQAYMDMTQEQKAHFESIRGYVPEGVVTDEIRDDLERLGWVAREWAND